MEAILLPSALLPAARLAGGHAAHWKACKAVSIPVRGLPACAASTKEGNWPGGNPRNQVEGYRSTLETLYQAPGVGQSDLKKESLKNKKLADETSSSEQITGDSPNASTPSSCPTCESSGQLLCTTCDGSGLYVDAIMESQGIIVKITCLGCGGSGSIMCLTCGGRGRLIDTTAHQT